MSAETNAGEWIVKTSQKEKARLVVVGPRGMGLIRRTILGNMPDYVIKHTKCAVAVVHADKTVKKVRMDIAKWRESEKRHNNGEQQSSPIHIGADRRTHVVKYKVVGWNNNVYEETFAKIQGTVLVGPDDGRMGPRMIKLDHKN